MMPEWFFTMSLEILKVLLEMSEHMSRLRLMNILQVDSFWASPTPATEIFWVFSAGDMSWMLSSPITGIVWSSLESPSMFESWDWSTESTWAAEKLKLLIGGLLLAGRLRLDCDTSSDLAPSNVRLATDVESTVIMELDWEVMTSEVDTIPLSIEDFLAFLRKSMNSEISFFKLEISLEESFCNFFNSSLDSFDSFCNFFNSSFDSFCIIWDLHSLISKSLDIFWLSSSLLSKFAEFFVKWFNSFCIRWTSLLKVLDSFSTVFFIADNPDLCCFSMETNDPETLLIVSSMATSRPSMFPMFSLIESQSLDTLLIFLLTRCLDLLFLELLLESLWQSSDSDDELEEEEFSLLIGMYSSIFLGGPSSSLLSSEADSNSEISSSFTLS